MSSVTYNNSPIREAIFDVKFKFKSTPELKLFENASKEIKEDYPKLGVTNFQSVSFEIKPDEEPQVNAKGGPDGLRLASHDGKKVAQFRTSNFIFSQYRLK